MNDRDQVLVTAVMSICSHESKAIISFRYSLFRYNLIAELYFAKAKIGPKIRNSLISLLLIRAMPSPMVLSSIDICYVWTISCVCASFRRMVPCDICTLTSILFLLLYTPMRIYRKGQKVNARSRGHDTKLSKHRLSEGWQSL